MFIKPSRSIHPILSVSLLFSLLIYLYTVYLLYIFLPGAGLFSDQLSRPYYRKSTINSEFVFCTLFVALLLISLIKAIFTSPGIVTQEPQSSLLQLERRSSDGEPRQCKWCGIEKPDRAHHCKECGKCILKMDHHCPWIFNCVGQHNYKYFYLSTFYGILNLSFFLAVALPAALAVNRLYREKAYSAIDVFVVFLAVFLAALCWIIVGIFFIFHTWLLCIGLTTIEFFEKLETSGSQPIKTHRWNKGIFRNLRDGLGPRPLLWLLPIIGA